MDDTSVFQFFNSFFYGTRGNAIVQGKISVCDATIVNQFGENTLIDIVQFEVRPFLFES